MKTTPIYINVLSLVGLAFGVIIFASLTLIFYLLKRKYPKYYNSNGQPALGDHTLVGLKRTVAAYSFAFDLLKAVPATYPKDLMLRKIVTIFRLTTVLFLVSASILVLLLITNK